MEAEDISTFCSITDASPEVAQGFLSLAGNDVQRAVGLFFENPELASNVRTGVSASEPPAAAVATASSRSNVGRRDSRGIIHIDSDDENDDFMQVDDDDGDRDDTRAEAAQTAALAQEEEDAAMAKRLQEELYRENHGSGSGAGGAMDEDGVRAPIGRTTETLVAPDPAWAEDGDDGFDSSAILNELRRRQMRPRQPGGPFSQQIWGDVANPPTQSPDENGSHARRLADLFRPPYDLMERGITWDDARTLGKEDKKWIMVNLQDMNDFNCQALNRDIWKDDAVRKLIKDHFLFLQYDKDYPDAGDYITFYFPNQGHENPDNYPHVSIIDPRTGEQVKVWTGRPFPSASDFHAELAEFLDRYSLEANSKNPVAEANSRKPQTVDVDRMTEEEMLEMALKNSLAGAGDSSGSSSTPNIHDPDALTKSPNPQAEGKGKEPEESPAQQSVFSQIPDSNPHTEPENNPATTTRIQFRHPTGRVIRRFDLQDPVRRIFEWLKAEPLEGREGVEFELKKMPQGQDLIENLDATIEESGLKQGTVMIEFLQD